MSQPLVLVRENAANHAFEQFDLGVIVSDVSSPWIENKNKWSQKFYYYKGDKISSALFTVTFKSKSGKIVKKELMF